MEKNLKSHPKAFKVLNIKFLNNGYFLLIFIFSFLCIPFLLHAEEQSNITADSILKWVNQFRIQKGLDQLDVDQRLNEAAGSHSEKMAEHDLLLERDAALGTPYERIRSSGLTDANNLVVVARASDWEHLKEQLDSDDNASKILSPEMTHLGAGIFQDTDGDYWVTLHMTERAITFTLFTMHQTTGDPVTRSMKINGNTPHDKVRALLIYPEGSRDPVEHIAEPDSHGDFELRLSFGARTGNFSFEFSVFEDEEYKLKNFFSMEIR